MAEKVARDLAEEAILEEVRELAKERRYGEVRVIVQAGQVDTISSTRTKKLKDLANSLLDKIPKLV